MQVRKYKVSDKEQLIALWENVFPDDPPHNNPEKMLSAKLAVDDLIFVAIEDCKVQGACMAGYDGHRGWLYAVAVRGDQRRRGIARALVVQTIESLQLLGCIKVNLQIRATNHEVAAFYHSLGFESEERLSMGKRLGD